MLLTFNEVKNSRVIQVASACSSGDEFKSLVNSATRRLMRRGDWSGTVIPIQVCAYKGCVVFPRWVGQVRKINVCKYPTPINNFWYDFFNKADWKSQWRMWCGAECRMTATGRTPVFQDIMGDGRLVRAYPQVRADIGRTITIFGLDTNNQPLRTRSATGTWTDGITLTIAVPFVSTSINIRRIDRVIKDTTQGDVYLYAYNSADDVLENIATYEPSDTNPSFVRYSLHIPCYGNTATSGTCGDLKSVAAVVKLQYIPVRADNDLVLIDNMDALQLMVQSIKHEEAGNRGAAREFEADAIRELNLQLQDDFPNDQIPIDLGELGGTTIGFQKMF